MPATTRKRARKVAPPPSPPPIDSSLPLLTATQHTRYELQPGFGSTSSAPFSRLPSSINDPRGTMRSSSAAQPNDNVEPSVLTTKPCKDLKIDSRHTTASPPLLDTTSAYPDYKATSALLAARVFASLAIMSGDPDNIHPKERERRKDLVSRTLKCVGKATIAFNSHQRRMFHGGKMNNPFFREMKKFANFPDCGHFSWERAKRKVSDRQTLLARNRGLHARRLARRDELKGPEKNALPSKTVDDKDLEPQPTPMPRPLQELQEATATVLKMIIGLQSVKTATEARHPPTPGHDIPIMSPKPTAFSTHPRTPEDSHNIANAPTPRTSLHDNSKSPVSPAVPQFGAKSADLAASGIPSILSRSRTSPKRQGPIDAAQPQSSAPKESAKPPLKSTTSSMVPSKEDTGDELSSAVSPPRSRSIVSKQRRSFDRAAVEKDAVRKTHAPSPSTPTQCPKANSSVKRKSTEAGLSPMAKKAKATQSTKDSTSGELSLEDLGLAKVPRKKLDLLADARDAGSEDELTGTPKLARTSSKYAGGRLQKRTNQKLESKPRELTTTSQASRNKAALTPRKAAVAGKGESEEQRVSKESPITINSSPVTPQSIGRENRKRSVLSPSPYRPSALKEKPWRRISTDSKTKTKPEVLQERKRSGLNETALDRLRAKTMSSSSPAKVPSTNDGQMDGTLASRSLLPQSSTYKRWESARRPSDPCDEKTSKKVQAKPLASEKKEAKGIMATNGSTPTKKELKRDDLSRRVGLQDSQKTIQKAKSKSIVIDLTED